MDKRAPKAPAFVSSQAHAESDPFRLLVDAVHDYAIFMLDTAGNVSSWNPGAEKIHGEEADAIIGQHLSTFYTPEDVEAGKPQQGLTAALENGRFEEEGQRLRKGGVPFWANVTITNIHDSAGQHIGFANVTQDITERKQAADTLRATTEPFRLLVEGVKDYAIFMLDATGNVSSWNPGAEKIQGQNANEVTGKYVSCFYPPEDVASGKPQRELAHAAAAGTLDVEGWRVRKNGERYWANGVLTALYDPEGKVRGFAKIIRDLTERERTERIVRAQYLITTVLNMTDTLSDALPSIFQAVCEALEWEYGEHFAFDPTSQTLRLAGSWHSPSPLLDEFQTISSEFILHADDQSLPSRVVASGGVEWVPDVCSNTYFLRAKLAENAGLRSAVSFPIISGSEVSGVITFFGNRIMQSDDAVVSMMTTIGIQIGQFEERKRAEKGLQLRDRAMESFMQGVSITDARQPDNPMVYVNDSFLRMTGYSRAEVVGKNCRFLQGPDTAPDSLDQIRSAVRDGRSCLVELINYRKDGTPFWNALSISAIHDSAGKVTHFVGVQTDISPFKQMERQFQQAQKMEAIGQLAGGVAHDFNNLLTVISGYSELLLRMLPATDSKRKAIKAISEAGERAAGLTRQLLFFSRQAVLEAKVLDLNEVVQETTSLLRRMLGEDILLTAILDPTLKRIKVDPGQIGQVLMNLAINARDAMPQGGKLTVETANVQLDETCSGLHSDTTPGMYVMLTVSDTGSGMTPEIQARIFEPFFTTKKLGKGTGLGLATVYGIVNQNAGSIDLQSEPDHGTVFQIYFPSVDDPLHSSAHDQRVAEITGGNETILLVEDEDAVRAIALLALQMQGYTVVQAESGKLALGIIEKHHGPLDILVTDVVMPGMSGRELAEALCLQRPGLKVLYLSGYTDDAMIRHGVLQADVAFLQKPYTPLSLSRKVREVLDSPPANASKAGNPT